MKRVYWVAPPVAGLALASLVYTGVLDQSLAIRLGMALDAGLWLLGAVAMLTVWRRTRRERAAGLDGWEAFERSVAEVLPRWVTTLLLAEVRVCRALARWIRGKAPRLPHRRRGADSC